MQDDQSYAKHSSASSDPAEILEIRDPEIDVDALMARIRANLAARGEALDDEPVAASGAVLYDRFVALQAKAGEYGELSSVKKGWQAQAELFLKKVLRKLMMRHIRQQQEVNAALVVLLNEVLGELDRQGDRQRQLEMRIAAPVDGNDP